MGADRQADVLVVGGGGAGLAAAIEASRACRSVILLEKNAELGGSTAWSVGSISVNRSPHQRRRGIADTVDEHFEDLELLAGRNAPRDNRCLRRLLVENITDTFDWLMAMGLVFAGPMPEPPHRYPRMHNVLPSSRVFAVRLGARARALGVKVRLGTRVTGLLAQGGRVVGVEVVGPGGESASIRARAVVLAAGDYSASPELLRELVSDAAAQLVPVNPTASGDGIRLGREVGGVVVNGDIVRGPVMRFVPPPRRRIHEMIPPIPALARLMCWGHEHLPDRLLRPMMMRFMTTALGLSAEILQQGATLVNSEGQRFGDETRDAAHQVARQMGGQAWAVLDHALAERFTRWPHFLSTAPGIAYAYLDDYRRTRRDVFHCGRTIEALARAAGLPESALVRTLTSYNASTEARRGRPPLDVPPFYALGPIKAYVVFTDGGLAVDEELRVLDADARPIPGLYAAGSNGQGGLLLEGHGHHLGWAFVSGRIAGRNAARASARPVAEGPRSAPRA